MTTTTYEIEMLNELTTEVTAFPNWIAFVKSMEAGYCPSLYPHAGRSKAQREWNAKVVRLADLVEEFGHKVFRGMN